MHAGNHVDVRVRQELRTTYCAGVSALLFMRLLHSKDNGWYIAEHREEHNHSLSPNCRETIHWASYKHIDVYIRDLIKLLRQNNVNLLEVYSIIGSFFNQWIISHSQSELWGICVVKSAVSKQKMMLGRQWKFLHNLGRRIHTSHIMFRLTRMGGSIPWCGPNGNSRSGLALLL